MATRVPIKSAAPEPSRALRPIACVSLPELPLQLLLHRHVSWRDRPVALVAEERPEESLLLLNARARQARLRTGMRFGVAKSLVPELCAGAVSELELEQAICELTQALQTFSPHVERDPRHPGVFYLDPTGLEGLYGGVACWARSVHRFVRGKGYYGSLVVGHGRSLSYAVAQGVRGAHVFDAAQTMERAHQVSLERLGMRAKTRDGLERLGLGSLGDLARFGVDALRMRFGDEAALWCRVAQGHEVLPLCAEPHAEALRVALPIDPPDTDVARLCFMLGRGLRALFEQLVPRGESAGTLWLTLKLERGGTHRERLEPARATRETALWLELLRLRLASVSLTAPVEEVVLEVESVRVSPGQETLFPSGRDLAAGDRALARVRAMFGEQSVRRARLCEGHLPEAKFRWEPVPQLDAPVTQAREDRPLPLVRRLHRPERFAVQSPLSATAVHNDISDNDASVTSGSLVRAGERLSLTGPYRLSGGWWVREVARDYYYAEAASGALFWVFYDHARAGWFEHARVE